MRPRTAVAIGLNTALAAACCTAFAACSGDDPAAAASAAFERFQDALFAADAAAVRALVTAESAPAVAAMPWQQLPSRRRLRTVAARDCRGSFEIAVRDPNDGDAPGTYVVVRENGRLVVDLVATAELSATPTAAAATTAPVLEPRQLTPADFAAIRRHELASPPADPRR